ncbi:MAG: 2-dehydropantoate 2-reductase [Candidatus Hodarchaeota archaeon]
MKAEDFKIAIIGVGPTGGILGAFLAQKNIDVTLVDVWKPHMDAIKEHGLQISGPSPLVGQFDTAHLKASILELKDTKPNLVFVAVKTPFMGQVTQDLNTVLPENAFVVSYQNGVGTEDYLAKTFGKERLLRGVINYAGNVLGPGKIEMTFFNPPNIIGSMSPKNHSLAKSIAKLMTEVELPTEFQEDTQPAVWKKTILNAALSGLCAVTHMTMREAMDFQETRYIVSNLLKEGLAVANAIGITFEPDFYDKCIAYLSKGGHHKPSMLCDIEARKPTEIAFLNEMIYEVGNQHNVPAPFNKAITSVVKAADFLNAETNKHVKSKLKEMGMGDECYDCTYSKDCVEVFAYCPQSGEPLPTKARRPEWGPPVFSELLLEERDEITILRINNPPANQLGLRAFREIQAAAEMITRNKNTKVLVITATGSKFFAAGIDLKEADDLTIQAIGVLGRSALRAIEALEIPTIVAINGFALGAGCELALAADIRIASSNAKFGQPEVKLGIIPGGGGTQRLTRLLGSARAAELILTGDIINAEQALNWGLITKIVPSDQLESEALSIANKILKNAPLAVQGAKQAIKMANRVMDLEAGLDFETQMFDRVFQSEDRVEGIKAFIEKRKPKFKGK